MKVGSAQFSQFLLSAKEAILRKTSDGITNTDSFIQLIALLESFKNKNSPIPAFCIILSEDSLKTLDFISVKNNLSIALPRQLQTHNHITVNNKFEILEYDTVTMEDTAEARTAYLELSKDKKCVIYVSQEGIQYFYDNHEYGNNLFLTDSDLKTYLKKRDLSEIDDVLGEYQISLKEHHAYAKFFVHKTTLKKIYADSYIDFKNLLRNKPENLFREDLRAFLNKNIKSTFNFSREYELDSEKRIDINTEDTEGNYYFFEIKWMGQSINPSDDGAGTSHGAEDMKDGVNQSLQYIKELKESRKTVKFGCLTIFDARNVKSDVALEPYSYVKEELKDHLVSFRYITDLRIENERPA